MESSNPTLVIVSADPERQTMTVRIKGVRYEYWFHGEVPLATVRKILRYSPGRAVQYLKKYSYKVVHMDNGEIKSTTAEVQTTQDCEPQPKIS